MKTGLYISAVLNLVLSFWLFTRPVKIVKSDYAFIHKNDSENFHNWKYKHVDSIRLENGIILTNVNIAYDSSAVYDE